MSETVVVVLMELDLKASVIIKYDANENVDNHRDIELIDKE